MADTEFAEFVIVAICVIEVGEGDCGLLSNRVTLLLLAISKLIERVILLVFIRASTNEVFRLL